MLPGPLPGSLTTDPSLPPSFSTLSLSLPLGQPLRDSGILSRSARPSLRDLQPLLGPFPPSSWSNASSLRASIPGLADVANRLSSPPLDLMSAASGCSSTSLFSSPLSQRRAVPAAISADVGDTLPSLTYDLDDDDSARGSYDDCDFSASPLF